MYNSLKFLFRSPYNKKYPFFAIARFIEWKIIKGLKLTNYKKKVWGNRVLLLNHDSFQSMWVMYNWIVDWEEFNLIKDVVKENDHCLDIGSNMGFYTIWFSKFTSKVISFEPNKKNFKRLSQNLEINGLDKVIVAENMALGETEGFVEFTKNRDGENHISISADGETETVRCRRLENVLHENAIKKIRYIKIDVEGFELAVLKGITGFLQEKQIDIIQVEINDAIANSGSSIAELLEFLASYGYRLCSYDVAHKQLKPELYTERRENYFLTADIDALNNLLVAN